jgi:cytochrome b6-f complex iron-sulfur subunit
MPRESVWLAPQDRFKVLVSVLALMAALLVGAISLTFIVSFSWPTLDLGSPPIRIHAGNVYDFEVGQPVEFTSGKFWLVKQADGSFIALYWKDPHLGCTVPWRPDFEFPDPRDGVLKKGWFRDPCYGATYDVNGVRVFGPSPRNLDQFPVEIVGNQVYVLASEAKLILGATPKY